LFSVRREAVARAGAVLTDAHLPIDNNASERALRVAALGRKNFLFVGTDEAGENLAGLYSLIAHVRVTRRQPRRLPRRCAALHSVASRVADRRTPAAQLQATRSPAVGLKLVGGEHDRREGTRARNGASTEHLRQYDHPRPDTAVALFDGAAEGNAFVVGGSISPPRASPSWWRGCSPNAASRRVQRAVAERRREQVAAALATVRFETAPGRRMQIDFGERKVWSAGERVTMYFLAAVLSYSRRIFVKAFLHERQGEWLDGIASAFLHFGGVPLEVLATRAASSAAATARAKRSRSTRPTSRSAATGKCSRARASRIGRAQRARPSPA
jgi:Transposase IS66 family